MKVTVRVTGDKAVRAGLKRASAHMSRVSEPTKRAAESVRSAAARLAPKRTGRLARGVTARVSGNALAVIADNVRYASFVENGTSYMRAQPFMRTALNATPILEPFEDHAEQSARLV